MSSKWDQYFYDIAYTTAQQSSCFSRKIGAVIVRDKAILATGYNGPPSGCAPCDTYIHEDDAFATAQEVNGQCPRRVLGYPSGEGLHICPAAHAERNAIALAARHGVCINRATMYLTCEIPCKDCLGCIVNAGITEIVCVSLANYGTNPTSAPSRIIEGADITVRTYHQDCSMRVTS